MSVVIVTGCLGQVGGEATKRFLKERYKVVGIDNDSRKSFFGEDGSTLKFLDDLIDEKNFQFARVDIRDQGAVDSVFKDYERDISAVIHTASLPAHETCDKNPRLAYDVNVTGTMNVLEAMRDRCPNAQMLFTSSSKTWGCRHNDLPYVELDTRWELPQSHPYYNGIPESHNPDHDERSFLGSTKLAADVLCQEYAYKFGIKTTIWRPVCLVGPQHRGVEAHGFLSYLTRCAIFKKKYTIYGYKGKQVRCNWHVSDMVDAFMQVFHNPAPLQIFNVGGSRHSNCSTLEAINIINEYLGEEMDYDINAIPRIADHKFAIGSSDLFLKRYPTYKWKYSTEEIIKELLDCWQYEKTHA